MVNDVTTKLAELNLVDRFLFDETMEDREVYQAVVSILLENEIELLDKPETEKEFRISPELRQVRLDVISMSSDKTLYYTEMQQKDTGNLRRRSRYYQAQLDVSLLEPGSKNFNLLNDSCFILIAPFDIFGKGLYRYTFEGTCRECPELKLEDGAIRIFINTVGSNKQDFSQEFLDFMEYITASTDAVADRTISGKVRMIHEKVKRIRASEKIGVKYMQLWEEKAYIRDEGLEEGLVKGRAEGMEEGLAKGHAKGMEEGLAKGEEIKLIQLVVKKLRKGKSAEEIADDLEESMEEIERIFNAAKECAPNYNCEEIYNRLRRNEKAL